MKRCVVAMALVLSAGIVQAEIGIISVAETKQLLDDAEEGRRPIVFDVRSSYAQYFRGHLPFAQHMNPDTLRGTDRGVPVQYLPDELLKPLLIRAGVDRARPHIIYGGGGKLASDDILSTAMLAYVLEKYGVEEIRLLNGGLPEWEKQKYPLPQEYFGNPTGTLPKQGNKEIGIDIDELLKRKEQPNAIVVDARPKQEYLGYDDMWLRKGHIPGAVSFHWVRLTELYNTHQLKPFDKVQEELEQAGITPDKEVIVYCGTSREASLLRFYLRHIAKYPKVRLYEGSWKEYVTLKQYPVETEENTAK
jgi:thiosulfate/3-mercaptopyruvate sulfurtransferase